MRLWTVQPIEFLERLKRDGKIHCDPSLSPFLGEDSDFHFDAAYDWIANQMVNRIGGPPAGVRYPIWAWHSLDRKHKRPDLRRIEFRSYDKSSVCIEIEIPEKDALLSDEVGWHVILNDGYYCDDDDANTEFDWFESLPPEAHEAVKIKSWERIFEVNNPQCQFIQATFWELCLQQVVDVRRINRKQKV